MNYQIVVVFVDKHGDWVASQATGDDFVAENLLKWGNRLGNLDLNGGWFELHPAIVGAA